MLREGTCDILIAETVGISLWIFPHHGNKCKEEHHEEEYNLAAAEPDLGLSIYPNG